MTSLELLQGIELWLTVKREPSKKEVDEYLIEIRKHIDEALAISRVSCQRGQLPIYYQIKRQFITPELKKRFPSIIEWAFEKEWWINNSIAKENEIEPVKK